jgi:hypothetical protein
MKKHTLCLFVLCSSLSAVGCPAAVNDTIVLSSEIKSVNVFFEGARVSRTAEINLGTGYHILVLDDLPASTEPEHLEISGPSGLRIMAVSHRLKTPSPESLSKDLKDRKAKLEEEVEWLRARKEVWNAEEALLMENTKVKQTNTQPYSEQMVKAADFYRNRLAEIQELRYENTKSIRALQDQISEINMEINRIQFQAGKPTLELMIYAEAKTALKGQLNINYFTSSAGWEPFYDFRFEEINQALDLVYNAKVYQSSGEDWNEVALTLSEGLPKQALQPGNFEPWYIDRKPSRKTSQPAYGPPSGAGSIKGKVIDSETGEPLPFVSLTIHQGGSALYGTTTDFEGNYTVKPIQAGTYSVEVAYVGYENKEFQHVRIQKDKITFLDIELESGVVLDAFEVVEYSVPMIDKDGGASGGTVAVRGSRSNITNVYIDGMSMTSIYLEESPSISAPRISYTVDYAFTIPSNGQDRLLTYKNESVPATYFYQVWPRIQTDVFLMARIEDWGELQLLSGPVNVYFKGVFSGESEVNARSVKDTLEVPLGRDEQIFVERKLDETRSAEKTFSNKIKNEMHWGIKIRNNKTHPVQLEVIDQYPLAESRHIEVEVLDTGGAVVEEKTGKLKWAFTLAGNSSEELGFGYELTYPQASRVYR